jgi:hypothetical protein
MISTASEAAVPSRDIIGFCRQHRDLDQPGRTYFGSAYRRGMLPEQVEATGATDWRCMGGKVFLCLNSADGGACTKKDPSRTPRAIIREVCREEPGTEYVPTYAASYSSSTWRCEGTAPKILKTFPLDRRGFLQATWVEYVVRDGAVVSPTEDDFGADPR